MYSVTASFAQQSFVLTDLLVWLYFVLHIVKVLILKIASADLDAPLLFMTWFPVG
jgi:hypothetical protein